MYGGSACEESQAPRRVESGEGMSPSPDPNRNFDFLCRNNAFWCTFDIGIPMRNFVGNSLPPCQQELRYFPIAMVASGIKNEVVQPENLRLPISGVHAHPSWIHTFAV